MLPQDTPLLKKIIDDSNSIMSNYNRVDDSGKNAFKQSGNAVLSDAKDRLTHISNIVDSSTSGITRGDDVNYIEVEKNNILSTIVNYKNFLNELFQSDSSLQSILQELNSNFDLITPKLEYAIALITQSSGSTQDTAQPLDATGMGELNTIFNELGFK